MIEVRLIVRCDRCGASGEYRAPLEEVIAVKTLDDAPLPDDRIILRFGSGKRRFRHRRGPAPNTEQLCEACW